MNKAFQKGLTLIEMLIVVSIVVIFSALVFGNYGTGKDGLALERAGQKLQQDIRKTQELAMSGSAGTGYNGFGIYFDEASSTSYILYKNNSSSSYLYNTAPNADLAIETINIETGVKICDIVDNGIYPSVISVSFAPPEPITRIEANNSGHEASIVLCIIADTTKTRTIKVNNVGRIEVNNP